jgi:hypothetical protein
MKDLDKIAVRRGALGVLMFVAPAYVLVQILASGNKDSSAWLLLAGALLFGSTFGGYAGARDRPPTPITHGAVSAALGLAVLFAIALTVQLLRGHLTLTAALTSVVMLQIGTALGCLGGLLAAKGARLQ